MHTLVRSKTQAFVNREIINSFVNCDDGVFISVVRSCPSHKLDVIDSFDIISHFGKPRGLIFLPVQSVSFVAPSVLPWYAMALPVESVRWYCSVITSFVDRRPFLFPSAST
jgi:hypothetical protein